MVRRGETEAGGGAGRLLTAREPRLCDTRGGAPRLGGGASSESEESESESELESWLRPAG